MNTNIRRLLCGFAVITFFMLNCMGTSKVCFSEEKEMGKKEGKNNMKKAETAFAAYVEKHHDFNLDEAQIYTRNEAFAPPFYAFSIYQGQGPERRWVEGVARADGLVITFRVKDAFSVFLKEADFANSDLLDARTFVVIYQLLKGPNTNPYGESVIPIVNQADLNHMPVANIDESLYLPLIERMGDNKIVKVWYCLEPGPLYQLYTFSVLPDNSFLLKLRYAKNRKVH